MADVLGEAAVVLSVQGESGLAAELAAVHARLEEVEAQAKKTHAALSTVVGGAGGGGPMAGGMSSSPPVAVASATPTAAIAPPRPAVPMTIIDEPATPGPRPGAPGGGPGGARNALLVSVSNRPLIVRVDGPVTLKQTRSTTGAMGPGAGGGIGAAAGVADINDKAKGTISNFDRLKTSADALGTTLASVFAAGTSSILGLVSAADPSMFSTFQSSIRLAAIEVGQGFVPYVEAAAAGLQTFAQWFGSLDEVTKGTVAKITIAATVIGGVGLAARAAAVAFGGLGTAAVTAGRMISFGLLSNPVTAGIVGVTALVATLAGAWWGVSKAADAAGASSGRAGQQRVGGGSAVVQRQVTEEEIEAMPDDYRRQFAAVAARRSRVEKDKALLDEDREPRYKELDDERQAIAARYFKDIGAQLQLLPQDARAAIEKDPKARSSAIDQEIKRTREIAAAQREGSVEQAKLSQIEADRRKEVLDRAAKDPKLDRLVQQQLAVYAARRNIDPDTAPLLLGEDSAKTPERKVIANAFFEAVRRVDPEMKVLPSEVLDGLKIAQLDPRREPERGTLQVPETEFTSPKKRQVAIDDQLRVARITEGRLKLLEFLASELGGGPDKMKQDLKLPFQTRYTGFDAYQESLQLKALDGNEASTAADIRAMKTTLERMEQGLTNGIGIAQSTEASLRALQIIFGS